MADKLRKALSSKNSIKIPDVNLGISRMIAEIDARSRVLKAINAFPQNYVFDYQNRIDAALKALDASIRIPMGAYLENIDKAIKAAILHTSAIERVQEILSSRNHAFEQLDKTLKFIGIFDFDENEISDVEDEVSECVDEDIKESLIQVEWFPIRLLHKIFNDPSYLRKIDPRKFEEFTACIVDKLGFDNVILTPKTGDGGRDVIARKIYNGIPIVYSFECKHYKESSKVGVEIIRSLLGSVSFKSTQSNIGVLVTTSSFTKGAKNFILNDARVDGKDYSDIMKWLEQIKHMNL